MRLFADSFWRAIAYCLHPRVIGLSFLPLAVVVAMALVLGYFFWAPAVDGVFRWIETSSMLSAIGEWLGTMGMGGLRTVIAPLVVIALATPAIVVVSLFVVAVFMTPAVVSLVADRRFPHLEKRRGASLATSVLWSLGSTLLALVALIVTMPLWLVPPLILLLPPLIWGWLTYRVMAFDAMAEHASREERRTVFRRHRLPLLAIGVVTGLLGAAPSVVWVSGVLFAAAFVILVPVAIWIYTLVFAFSSLWFGHYCLAALEQLRAESAPPGPVALPDAPRS
ncbi:EI24 domain-containing protein [Ramlibacter algicola]|uniref:EI24 domain-containing protein n=1 Tax=Ramlibacter algicola TaxID=2795217 RepID=A0A934Q4K7_9BURK|nr:EI24 domain-containing protein [Ramlibacter algicola]MBK0394154.1 EI24 domain-containing protein [Ramlibacter algicola]